MQCLVMVEKVVAETLHLSQKHQFSSISLQSLQSLAPLPQLIMSTLLASSLPLQPLFQSTYATLMPYNSFPFVNSHPAVLFKTRVNFSHHLCKSCLASIVDPPLSLTHLSAAVFTLYHAAFFQSLLLFFSSSLTSRLKDLKKEAGKSGLYAITLFGLLMKSVREQHKWTKKELVMWGMLDITHSNRNTDGNAAAASTSNSSPSTPPTSPGPSPKTSPAPSPLTPPAIGSPTISAVPSASNASNSHTVTLLSIRESSQKSLELKEEREQIPAIELLSQVLLFSPFAVYLMTQHQLTWIRQRMELLSEISTLAQEEDKSAEVKQDFLPPSNTADPPISVDRDPHRPPPPHHQNLRQSLDECQQTLQTLSSQLTLPSSSKADDDQETLHFPDPLESCILLLSYLCLFSPTTLSHPTLAAQIARIQRWLQQYAADADYTNIAKQSEESKPLQQQQQQQQQPPLAASPALQQMIGAAIVLSRVIGRKVSWERLTDVILLHSFH